MQMEVALSDEILLIIFRYFAAPTSSFFLD